jgi:hypothetical protein
MGKFATNLKHTATMENFPSCTRYHLVVLGKFTNSLAEIIFVKMNITLT